MTIASIRLNDDFRLTVSHDEDAHADNPRDWGRPGHMFYPTRSADFGYSRRDYLQPERDDTPGPFGDAYAHFRDVEWSTGRHPQEMWERWVAIFHPGAVIWSGGVHCDAPDVIAYLTEEEVEKEHGGDREKAQHWLADEIDLYRQWANGEVYRLELLRRQEWVSKDDPDAEMTTWEHEDGIGGVYADAYADEAWTSLARGYFDWER